MIYKEVYINLFQKLCPSKKEDFGEPDGSAEGERYGAYSAPVIILDYSPTQD